MTPEQIAELEALVAKADGKFYSVEKILDADRTLNRFLREHLPAILAALKAQQPGEDVVERVARVIDPGSWAVMDGYLADMKRKYRGQNAAYDPDNFKHKGSMATARAAIAAMQESRDD